MSHRKTDENVCDIFHFNYHRIQEGEIMTDIQSHGH